MQYKYYIYSELTWKLHYYFKQERQGHSFITVQDDVLQAASQQLQFKIVFKVINT